MIKYDKGNITEIPDHLPQEYPLKLSVNGKEIATLVASPHELRFLVAGFLRTQGFVHELDDILLLGVCEDYAIANVKIRGEVPERLTPVLTSGCGTWISFSLSADSAHPAPPEKSYSPAEIFSMMKEMGHLSERYGRHGGIHSAAVSDGSKILFHAEDLGRHNTIDRLAGHALLSKAELSGTLLLTSGRVSAEMAAKASSLGVAMIATRTSPTDMAVRICSDNGIGIASYVRGESFRIAASPERFRLSKHTKISSVAGVILAGGESSRIGSNKALMTVSGKRMIEIIYSRLSEIFDELLLVTNTPEIYDFIPCRKVPDIHPRMGPLGGIHAALSACKADNAFVTACDMPEIDINLVRELCTLTQGVDVIIPETAGGLEPLHAVYSKSCIPKMEKMLKAGERRILSFFELAKVRLIPRGKIAAIDPDFSSFRNINTPEDYRILEQSGSSSRS